MNVFGTVERDAHQKIVRREQVAPRLVDQRAVGLKGVLDAFAVGVFPLELHGPAVEIDAQQQRFAAVTAELDEVAGRAGRLEHRREGNGAGLLLGVAEREDVFRFHRQAGKSGQK